ncbi:hypothetical protein NL676_023942 [Syzygium grande]|nr:hypothetical protein NL676_023942 [Syzygium grande]
MLPELIPKILLSSWDLNLISSNGFSLMYFEGFTVKGLGLQGGRMLYLSWVEPRKYSIYREEAIDAISA